MDTIENRPGAAAPRAVEFSSDPWIYRIVVVVLGLVVLLVVIGGIILALTTGKDVPQGVLAIGSAAAGGLVGLLVPSPVNRSS
jgi:hypothetical protein